jgi:hypothetical protein
MTSRPALQDISGQEAWDATVDSNNGVLRDGPMPIAVFASLAAFPDADLAESCLAVAADSSLLYYSKEAPAATWTWVAVTTA